MKFSPEARIELSVSIVLAIVVAAIGGNWIHRSFVEHTPEFIAYSALCLAAGAFFGTAIVKLTRKQPKRVSLTDMGISENGKEMAKILQKVGSIVNPNGNELYALDELDRHHMLDISVHPNTGAKEYRLKEQFWK